MITASFVGFVSSKGSSSDILSSQWYVRAQASQQQVEELFGQVQLLSRENAPQGEVAFLTQAMTEPEVKEKAAQLQVGSLFRVLG